VFEIAVGGSGKAAHPCRTGRRILSVGSAFCGGSGDRGQQPLEALLVLAATELANSVGKAEKLSGWLPREFHPWQLLPADSTRCPFGLPAQCTLPGAEGSGLRGVVETAGKRLAASVRDDLAEPMDDAQCGFIGDFETPVELVRSDRTARGIQQEAGLEPFVKRHVAAFEHRADRGAELLAAATTEFQTGTRAFSGDRANPVGGAAAPAYRAVRPNNFLELGVRSLLIPKIGLQKDRHNHTSPNGGPGA